MNINILYCIHLFNSCFPKLFHLNITGIIFVRSIPSFGLNNTRSWLDIAFVANKKSWILNICFASFRGKFLKRPLKGRIGILYNHGPGVTCMNALRLPFSHRRTLGPLSGLRRDYCSWAILNILRESAQRCFKPRLFTKFILHPLQVHLNITGIS